MGHKSRLGIFRRDSRSRMLSRRQGIRGTRTSLITSRGFAILIFGVCRSGNAIGQVSLNAESIENSSKSFLCRDRKNIVKSGLACGIVKSRP